MRKIWSIAFLSFLICINLSAECLLHGVQSLETGSERADLTVADFNRDGYPDVAIAGHEAGVIRVFLNQKDGSFLISNEQSFRPNPVLIKAADFNGDLFPDLVVAGAGSIAILQNDGAGKFSVIQRLAMPGITAIAAADFNSDSIADLAVLTRNGTGGTISVLMNTKGSFTKTQSLSVKSPTDMIAAALGTGHSVDLIASSEEGTLTIWKGSSGGTFQGTTTTQAVPGAAHLAAGLINGDNVIDLVVAGSHGVLGVLLGENENEFKKIQLSTSADIQGIALEDFNDDHKTDLLLVNHNFRSVMYAGNGSGSFSFVRQLPFGLFTGAIASADFNRDNKADFVAAEAGSAGVYLRNGKNDFALGIRVLSNQGGHILAGDFDGDGNPDVIVTRSNGSTLIRGKGNGTFYPAVSANLPQLGYASVSDLDGDGKDDIVGFDRFTLKSWLSGGRGDFRETDKMFFGIDPQVQTLDVNADGLPDIAVMVPSHLVVFLNEGNGQFDQRKFANFYYFDKGILADLNGDKIPDLVAIKLGKKSFMRIFLGGPNFSFTKEADFALDQCPGSISAGDANGDGKTDILIGSSCSNRLSLFLGDGTGNFSAVMKVHAGSGSSDPMFVDLNGDGKPEIVAIAANIAKPSVSLAPDFKDYQLFGPFFWSSLAVADFNRDGHFDLAVSSYNSTAVLLNCQ